MTSPEIPIFTRDAIREVDRAAMEDYGIPGIVLMENAARGVSQHAMDMVAHVTDRPPRISIVCGSGNNGGDGYAAARHLHNCGVDVTIVTIGESKPESDAGINAAICRRMGLQMVGVDAIQRLNSADLLIDAVFGTGLTREVGEPFRGVIDWMNEAGVPILAVDCPSGLDCETGEVLGACIIAMRTVTFVGWKQGFLRDVSKSNVGDVHVVDIGAPRELATRLANHSLEST